MKKEITLQSQPWKSKLGAKRDLLSKISNLPPVPIGLDIKLETPKSEIDNYHPRIEETTGEETVDGGVIEGIANLLFIPPRGYKAVDTLTLTGEDYLIREYISQIR